MIAISYKNMYNIKVWLTHADMAQLVEQRIRNAQVVGSSPTIGLSDKDTVAYICYGIFLLYSKSRLTFCILPVYSTRAD